MAECDTRWLSRTF